MTLGIDVGGTNIKFGVVDETYKIIKKHTIRTEAEKGDRQIVSNIISKCREIQKEYPFDKIGIGTPGRVNSERGVCIRASNLPWHNTPIVDMLEAELGIKAALANDATCAICGELRAGTGRQYKDFIMITLGTGVGGGICINGRPYFGKNGAAGDFGHMTIKYDGPVCRCGCHGCYEHYASVSALIRQTKEAVAKNPESLLARFVQDGVTGKSAFDAMLEGCNVAADVVEQYAEYVAEGIRNLDRIFAPEAIVIGGAIAKQKENLLIPIREKVGASINVVMSDLGNDAGIIGAVVIAEN